MFLSCLSSQLLKLPFVKLSPTEHAVALRELSDAIGVIDVDQIEGKRMDDAVPVVHVRFFNMDFVLFHSTLCVILHQLYPFKVKPKAKLKI